MFLFNFRLAGSLCGKNEREDGGVCQQGRTLYKLLAVDPMNPDLGPFIGRFRISTHCSCSIERSVEATIPSTKLFRRFNSLPYYPHKPSLRTRSERLFSIEERKKDEKLANFFKPLQINDTTAERKRQRLNKLQAFRRFSKIKLNSTGPVKHNERLSRWWRQRQVKTHHPMLFDEDSSEIETNNINDNLFSGNLFPKKRSNHNHKNLNRNCSRAIRSSGFHTDNKNLFMLPPCKDMQTS